jgi:hypothetical protein
MAALLPITGTVSVGFDGMDAQSVGTFSVPVTMTLDTETGRMQVEPVADSSVIFAMVAALQGAADELLATIQTATAETIAFCPTCDAPAAVSHTSITIEHGPNGHHIVNDHY